VILVARKADGPNGLLEAARSLREVIPDSGHRIVTIACDLSELSEVERLVREVQKLTPKIDILIANAGATWGGPLETTPDSSISKVLDLNVRSIINIVRL